MGARITVDLTDSTMAAHFAHAVAAHAAWARTQRIKVPERLIEAGLDAKKWATAGQSGPMLPAADDPGDDAPMLLSIPGAAHLLGLSESTVKRLLRAEALPVVMVGSTRRIRRADVEGYVRSLGADDDTTEHRAAREGQ